MLSRLKGIETNNNSPFRLRGRRLWICFPVWRELKRDSYPIWQIPSRLWICFPVWRELKQVAGRLSWSAVTRCFGYAFPFEGNWNSDHGFRIPHAGCLWICFPVWRELKREGGKYENEKNCDFGYAFPFEGNWNLISSNLSSASNFTFGYAFPFEGNWNFQPYISLHSPVCFGYAFPFEGNWNVLHGVPVASVYQTLWICFPVWRELKLHTSHNLLNWTFKALDMLSRLKGIETLFGVRGLRGVCGRFGYAFPFEGNWNVVNINRLT